LIVDEIKRAPETGFLVPRQGSDRSHAGRRQGRDRGETRESNEGWWGNSRETVGRQKFMIYDV